MGGWGKDYIDHQDFFLCECGNLEHQFIFQIHDWRKEKECIEENPEENLTFSMGVHLPNEGFWRRFKLGIRYIFGYKSRYGDWDSVILTYSDAQRIIDGMIRYRKLVQEYRKKLDERKFNEG